MSVVFLIVSLGAVYTLSSQITGLQSQISSQQVSIAQQSALIGLYANASGFNTAQAQKIAAAKAEGSVTVYSDQAPGTDPQIAAFEQAYGINVNFVHFA